MSTSSGSRDDDRFDELAKEFAERYRRGELPGLQEYVDRLPEMADKIRETFPTLVEVEQAQPGTRVEAPLAVQGRPGPVSITDATGAVEPTLAEPLPASQTPAPETRLESQAQPRSPVSGRLKPPASPDKAARSTDPQAL